MIKQQIDRLGLAGIIFTVLATPCCFPLLIDAFSVFGIGSFELFGGWTMHILEILVLISLIGNFLNFRQHKNGVPLVVGVVGAALIYYATLIQFNDWLVYAGIVGLIIASVQNFIIRKRNKTCGTVNKLKELGILVSKNEPKLLTYCAPGCKCGVNKEPVESNSEG